MGASPVRRHTWREVMRQIRESGAAGVVAVLLVALATTLGGLLVAARQWVNRELLPGAGPATVVGALRSPEAAAGVLDALHARFPRAEATTVQPSALQKQLAAEYPEFSSVLYGLDQASFPALLEARVPAGEEPAVAAWLGANPAVSLVESSRQWQERLEGTVRRVLWAGMGLAAALLLGCSVLVLLVVRLLVLDHGDEIAIMRLIGAHEADIRLPYLASGTFLGLAGGVLGALALTGALTALAGAVPELRPLAPLLAALPFVGGAAAAAGAVLGLAALPGEP